MVCIIRIAVLSSTRATDMDALVDAVRYDNLDAEIVAVASNKKCPALDRAQGFGIPALFVEQKGKDKEEYDKALYEALAPYKPDIILLIGYMRFLTKWFLGNFPDRVLNIHPSLLPDFAGEKDPGIYESILAAGRTKTGATLHIVDENPDHGPVIFQKEVAIVEGETPETLKAKVQAVEQELIVKAIGLFSRGKITVIDNKVLIENDELAA